MTDAETSWDDLINTLRHVKDSRYIDPIHRGLLDRIQNSVLYDDSLGSEISLVHYTTWKNALDMFNPNGDHPVLRMYNYEQSSDPDEGQIKPPEWKELEEKERKSWLNEFLTDDDRWRDEMNFGTTYGCSFSSGPSEGVEDDLTYWRLYGNDGQGCSLKISRTHGMGVYKVRYRDRNFNSRNACDKKEDEQVAGRLRELFLVGKETVDKAHKNDRERLGRTVAEGLLRIIYAYYHLVKHIAYAGEKEWRMIAVMPESKEIQYDIASENLPKRYVKGPALSELLSTNSAITVGPTVLNRGAARAYLEYLAKERHEISYVIVKNSRQTYRQVPSP